MEASGSGKPASKAGVKPHWMVSGTAALVREHYHKDLTYAGAMIDSNVHKDISAAVNGSSSSSGLQGGSSGLSRCRPASAPAGRADKNSSALNDNSSSEPNKTSTTAAAEGSQERRQVESRVRAELQHRTEQLLRARGATCPSTGVQQQGGGEAPVSDVQQQQEQQLVLAEYVVLLQDELSRWVDVCCCALPWVGSHLDMGVRDIMTIS